MSSLTKISCIGDRVRAGAYLIHSRFDSVINFCNPMTGRMIALVGPEVGDAPSNIVLNREPIFCTNTCTLIVEDKQIRLDDITLPLKDVPIYNSMLTLGEEEPDHNLVMQNLNLLEQLLINEAPEKSLAFVLDPEREEELSGAFEQVIATQFKKTCAEILEGDLTAMSRIRGLGWGLTPCGDDFTVGMIMAEQVARQMGVYHKLPLAKHRATKTLSDWFILEAVDGHYSEHWKHLLNELMFGEEASLQEATNNVMEIGSTSGADTATGLVIGMKSMMKKRDQ